jgi:hypothetical protein
MKKFFYLMIIAAGSCFYSCSKNMSTATASADTDKDAVACAKMRDSGECVDSKNEALGDMNDRGNYESQDTDYGRLNHSKNLSDQGNDASPDTGINDCEPGASNRWGRNGVQEKGAYREIDARVVPGSGGYTGTGVGSSNGY